MECLIELQFEIEPIVPDTLFSAKSEFQAAISEAFAESRLGEYVVEEPRATFEQRLPMTKDQLELATLILAFIIKEGPQAWEMAKNFLTSLRARLKKKPPRKIDFSMKIGSKEISAKGLSLDDAIKAVIDNYELELQKKK